MEEIVQIGFQKQKRTITIGGDGKEHVFIELLEDITPKEKTFKEKVEDVLRGKGLIA